VQVGVDSDMNYSRKAGPNEKGLSKIGLFFFVIFVGAGVYIGSQVINFFYCFYEIEGLMEFQAKKGQEFKDSEIRANIFERIQKLEVPVDDPEEIKINRVDGKLVIDLHYTEVLSIDFRDKSYDLHVFHFRPHVATAY
jgi:hypothetical protein